MIKVRKLWIYKKLFDIMEEQFLWRLYQMIHLTMWIFKNFRNLLPCYLRICGYSNFEIFSPAVEVQIKQPTWMITKDCQRWNRTTRWNYRKYSGAIKLSCFENPLIHLYITYGSGNTRTYTYAFARVYMFVA